MRENWKSRYITGDSSRVFERIRLSRISRRTGSPTRNEAREADVALCAMMSRILARALGEGRRVSPGSRLCEVAARWLRDAQTTKALLWI